MKKGQKMTSESRAKMSVSHTGKKRPEITTPIANRIANKTDKKGPLHPVLGTSCWLWTGAKFQNTGYGQIQIEGSPKRVHRVVWEMVKGPIPIGLLVLHKCDVRHCINPSHLFIGDQQANVDDMAAKGRKKVSFGERHSQIMKRVAVRGDKHWTRRSAK